MIRGPVAFAISTMGSMLPISSRPTTTVTSGAVVNTASRSRKLRLPIALFGGRPDEGQARRRRRGDRCRRAIARSLADRRSRPDRGRRSSPPPRRARCAPSAGRRPSSCCAAMCRGSGGATTGSTKPSSSSSSKAAARRSSSSAVARKVRLRPVPGRRPVRPRRCRTEATVVGAPSWITRSRSPTSMPELEGGRRHDDAVARLRERRLRPPALVDGQRRVRHERVDLVLPQPNRE